MNLRISGKHMEIGDAFRSRIEGRISEAIDKYFDGGFSGHVTVEKSGSRFAADCMVRLDTGISLQATGEAQEPVSAFDVAAEKFETSPTALWRPSPTRRRCPRILRPQWLPNRRFR
jgi:ribosomal subunit interface protein